MEYALKTVLKVVILKVLDLIVITGHITRREFRFIVIVTHCGPIGVNLEHLIRINEPGIM